MTSGNQSTAGASSVKQDRIASAILIGTGLLLLAGELDIVPDRLHLSMLHPWMEWWPLLFVVSGSILLVASRGARLLPSGSGPESARGEEQ